MSHYNHYTLNIFYIKQKYRNNPVGNIKIPTGTDIYCFTILHVYFLCTYTHINIYSINEESVWCLLKKKVLLKKYLHEITYRTRLHSSLAT